MFYPSARSELILLLSDELKDSMQSPLQFLLNMAKGRISEKTYGKIGHLYNDMLHAASNPNISGRVQRGFRSIIVELTKTAKNCKLPGKSLKSCSTPKRRSKE